VLEPGGDHAHRDVRRVERVMPDRSRRIIGRRSPVHERYRTERRLADRRARHHQTRSTPDRQLPHRGELHQEVMRMLAIDDRPPLPRLADLKQVAVPPLGDRFEAEHAGQRQSAGTRLPAQHAHPPVLAGDLGLAERAALVVERDENDAVLHEVPAGRRRRRLVMFVLRVRRWSDDGQDDEREKSTTHEDFSGRPNPALQ
jgi:hypothetical protein